MRPVEQTSTCWASQPSACAVSAHISRASTRPGSPVPALALPLLSTTAAAMPPVAVEVLERDLHRRGRHLVTGGDGGRGDGCTVGGGHDGQVGGAAPP